MRVTAHTNGLHAAWRVNPVEAFSAQTVSARSAGPLSYLRPNANWCKVRTIHSEFCTTDIQPCDAVLSPVRTVGVMGDLYHVVHHAGSRRALR
jgi:hypothetical protein